MGKGGVCSLSTSHLAAGFALAYLGTAAGASIPPPPLEQLFLIPVSVPIPLAAAESRCGSCRPGGCPWAAVEPGRVPLATRAATAGASRLGPCPPGRRVTHRGDGSSRPSLGHMWFLSRPRTLEVSPTPRRDPLPLPSAPPAPAFPLSSLPAGAPQPFWHRFGVDTVPSHVSPLHLQALLGLNRDRLSPGTRFLADLRMK